MWLHVTGVDYLVMNATMDKLDEVRSAIDTMNRDGRHSLGLPRHTALVTLEATLLQRVKNGIRHY